jgi:hypothetical protein
MTSVSGRTHEISEQTNEISIGLIGTHRSRSVRLANSLTGSTTPSYQTVVNLVREPWRPPVPQTPEDRQHALATTVRHPPSCSCQDVAKPRAVGRLEGCSSGESLRPWSPTSNRGLGPFATRSSQERRRHRFAERARSRGTRPAAARTTIRRAARRRADARVRPPGCPTSDARARPRTPGTRGRHRASIAGSR